MTFNALFATTNRPPAIVPLPAALSVTVDASRSQISASLPPIRHPQPYRLCPTRPSSFSNTSPAASSMLVPGPNTAAAPA